MRSVPFGLEDLVRPAEQSRRGKTCLSFGGVTVIGSEGGQRAEAIGAEAITRALACFAMAPRAYVISPVHSNAVRKCNDPTFIRVKNAKVEKKRIAEGFPCRFKGDLSRRDETGNSARQEQPLSWT
jgi:hypothetical protein